jgi:hypothetical protein
VSDLKSGDYDEEQLKLAEAKAHDTEELVVFLEKRINEIVVKLKAA